MTLTSLQVPQILLGSTDIKVSRLGLGTVKFGRNTGVKYPHSFQLPTDNEINKLLNCAEEANINLLDTATAYGSSEQRLGTAIKHNRHKWVICSKAGEQFTNNQSVFNFNQQFIIDSIHSSLRQLQTDYLDILLIHSNGINEEQIINRDQVFTTLAKLKQQGVIRAFGMSCKTVAGGILAAEMADMVMVTLNLNYSDDLPVIARAQQLNKGVIIKKALDSGKLPIKPSMEFIFQHPGINSVILGTINRQHLIYADDLVVHCS